MKNPAITIAVLFMFLFLAGSCRTVIRTADNRILCDSLRNIGILHDSIHIRDSVIIRADADTVTVREVRYLTRYRTKTDTVEKYICDTVYRTVTLPAPASSSCIFQSLVSKILSILAIPAIICIIYVSVKKK